ncbi:hypothetical protein ACO2Q3_25760 [Caulobacter sp. KR2-114]|uniref:hypothetical protein n=1 Tax=Caulobacter sp. KR2-114 TaxID=3400912 RepID=UPI003BFC6F4F
MKRKPPDKGRPGGFGRKPPKGAKDRPLKQGLKTGLGRGPVADQRELVKRATLNALKRAKRAADKAGVELSAWEDEFLGSVGERIKTYGRAFGDPDKGAPGQALSMMQAVKLKEIAAKAKGEKRAFPPRRGRGRKPDPEA